MFLLEAILTADLNLRTSSFCTFSLFGYRTRMELIRMRKALPQTSLSDAVVVLLKKMTATLQRMIEGSRRLGIEANAEIFIKLCSRLGCCTCANYLWMC